MVLSALQKKNFSIHLSKTKTKLCLSLHYNGDSSYLFVNRKKSISSKPIIKMYTCLLNIFWEVDLKNLVKMNLKKYLLKEMCAIFQSITVLLVNLIYERFTST